LTPAAVQAGASDGAFTELVDSTLPEGTLVVTRAASTTASSAAPAAATNGNPLMPSRSPRR
jgi:hypothetical protein